MATQKAQVRLDEIGFKAAIGAFLGVAIALAVGRTYIRIILTHRITVDDGFFFLAVITLIAGTTTLYVDVPYLFIQQNVDPSTTVITPAFIQFLLRSLKIQSATDVLLSVTLFSVKYSFLFFFHGLLRRVRWLTIWWWCVLAMMVPLSIIFMCCIFMVCPYFDERVLIKCSTPTAVRRENDILRASAFMDIFTDILLISIPVALLWRVRIPLQRKLMLGGILSLSIFTMIVSIVRIAGADLPNGMVDSAWVNFWLQIEAAVAVIVVSISAYRSLFVVAKSSHGHHGGKSPRYGSTLSAASYRKRLWSRIRGGDEKGGDGGGGGGGGGGGRRRGDEEEVQLPTLPDPVLTGVRTVIGRAVGGMGGRSSSEEEFLRRDSRGIFVRREAEVASSHRGDVGRAERGYDFI